MRPPRQGASKRCDGGLDILIGAAIAMLGIFLSASLGNPHFDPLASILIGILLAAVALLPGRGTGALLIGERTNRARIRQVRKILHEDPAVERIGELLTMQLGPQQALLTARVEFRGPLSLEELESSSSPVKNSHSAGGTDGGSASALLGTPLVRCLNVSNGSISTLDIAAVDNARNYFVAPFVFSRSFAPERCF